MVENKKIKDNYSHKLKFMLKHHVNARRMLLEYLENGVGEPKTWDIGENHRKK